MKKDPTEFRQRFALWKNGELVYKDGLPTYRGGKDSGKINYSRWDDSELTSYEIPFIEDKAIKLTNAGRATGAVLSTNLLDSIADNANRAGLPLLTALGLAVKESTLGNPTDDRSAWRISSGIRNAFNNKYPGTRQHINYYGDVLAGDGVVNYFKGRKHWNDDSKYKSVIQEAFEFYKQHPDKYNPGQKNYQTSVDKRGVEVMQSPEIKRWKNAYDTKKKVRPWTKPNPLLKESKFNLPKYAGGKIPEYVQAGKDNSWARVTNDPMGAVFLDLVVRPLSRGGNTTVGNWKRLWSPKYEKPLETVSPEFDIISGIRGLLQMLTPKKQIEHIDFDRFRTAVAKLKSDDDAWRAAHPEMEIENVLKKPQLPNVYESFPPELIHDVAKDPYYNLLLNAKTSADVAKISPTVRSYAGIGFDNSFDRAYTNLKLFLQSPAYRKRLENYYKLKGSSSVTINHAPDDRIGELLYNIETAKATVRPPGHLVDENGAVKDAFGLYDPNSHSIQVAVDALGRLTPEHEMWHAARRARAYLDNAKYKMRVRSLSDLNYYGDISELEVRVLDTLREMQESGLDINNLTDDQIWNFFYETPIDSHGTNVQSLIDNYWYDDVKNALRNFKGLSIPITMGIGYTKLKPIQTMKSDKNKL